MQTHLIPSAAAGATVGGRYRIEGVLGQGGIGVVHTAFDEGTGQRVALKRLLSNDPRARALFEREYLTLAALRHPGIVSVHDYGVDDAGPFYTMELLEGEDLAAASPRPWPEVCACLRDVAAIIGMLHARRLVHRDVGPRNLWRTPEGHIKLLDFGTLAPFGSVTDPVGTPPLVAPEVLAREPLDQRADLYALGALGYWMLTSAHAFRASALGELPRLWKQRPARPSELARLSAAELPEIPEELDALILALLSEDRDARPVSSLDVVDRLQALVDMPALDSRVQAGSAHLQSKAFVGREEVIERFGRRVRRARKGRPQALWIEGDEGLGKTRLLQELGTLGRLRGALVIEAAGADSTGAFDGASRLALGLFEACPLLARAIAEPHHLALAQVSVGLRARLQAAGLDSPSVTEALPRAVKQQALHELFCGAARERLLAIVVDDIERMDEESQALLAALPFATEQEKVLLVASCRSGSAEDTGTLAHLRREATAVSLSPLSHEQTQRLLESIFGTPPNLERVATRLHGLSGGNPQHSLVLVEQLIETGMARYADASWSLPKDLSSSGLPTSLQASVLARLSHLDEATRQVARRLAVLRQDYLPAAAVDTLLGGEGRDGASRLDALVQASVLAEMGDSWRFAHPSLREALQRELDGSEQRLLDGRLAQWLERTAKGGADILRLRAALHWLRAGELDRAHDLLVTTLAAPDASVAEALRETAPVTAEIVDGLSQAGRSDTSLAYGLGILCVAGYFVDPSYADRYAERGMAALTYLVPTGLARRLRPFVGPKLALVVAVVIASWRLKRGPYPLELKRVIQLLSVSVAALTGAESTRMQPRLAAAYAEALQPLTALGERHIVTAAYRMARELAWTACDESAAPYRSVAELIEWLEQDGEFEGAEEDGVTGFVLASRFIQGLRGNFLDDGVALAAAEVLERDGGPLYQLNVHQLRAMHHATRGEWEQAELCRKRMGVQAIQMGMSWRTDVVAPMVTMPAIWARDAVALKRAAEQLERLSAEMPGFVPHHRAALCAYHVVRGTPEKAIALLSAEDETPALPLVAGWARTRGVLAAATTAVGRPREALEICDDALARLAPGDLGFVGLTLNVQVERALALGALDEHVRAGAELDALLKRHAGRGPLVRLYLRDAAAQLALGRGDLEACAHHLEVAEALARETHSSGQRLHLRELDHRRRVAAAPPGESGMADGPLSPSDEHLALRVQLVLRTAMQDPERVPGKLADIASEITGASTGFFVRRDPSGRTDTVAARDGVPDPRALQWVEDRLSRGDDEDADTTDSATGDSLEDPNLLSLDGTHYTAKIFWTVQSGRPVASGALVLGFADGQPVLPRNDVLAVMSDCMTQLGGGQTTHGSFV